MKKLLSLILIIGILLSLAVPVSAEVSAKATASSSSVLVGNTVKVTFTFTADEAIAACEPRITYDKNVFSFVSLDEGGSGNANTAGTIAISYFAQDGFGAKTYKLSATFKSLKVGEGKFIVDFPNLGLHTADLQPLGSPTASVTVAVKEENKSSNANLKWLTVPKGCTLEPAFNKNITEYTCTVPGSVTSFPMDWEREDSKASDKVSGSLTLKVGENKRSVTVIAEDGTKKVYTVTITRLKPEATPTPTATAKPTATPAPTATPQPMSVYIDSQEYKLCYNVTLSLPEGFSYDKFNYNGTEVQVATLGNLMLMQLFDGARDVLFIYDASADEFMSYVTLGTSFSEYTVLAERPAEIPVDAEKKHLVIGDGEYTAWKLDELGEGYYILNVVNSRGENYPAVYCEYDSTVQKLSLALIDAESVSGDAVPTDEIKHNGTGDKPTSNMRMILIVACVAGFLFVAIVIIMLIVTVRKNNQMAAKERPRRQWAIEDPYDIELSGAGDKRSAADDDDEDFH